MSPIFTTYGACTELDLKLFLAQKEFPAAVAASELLHDGRTILTADARVMTERKWISCEIDGLISQCGVCVFHHWLANDGDAPFKEHIEKCVKLAQALKYTRAIATLTTGWKLDKLKGFGFVEIMRFVNKRTQNTVVMLAKEIPE